MQARSTIRLRWAATITLLGLLTGFGITTEELVAANRELEAASLIVAHNAAFDRPFVDRRLPVSRGKAWGCSLREVPWRGAGYASSALEFLLIKKSRLFFDGHRADADCHALLHLPLEVARLVIGQRAAVAGQLM